MAGDQSIERIRECPAYQELIAKRTRFGWILTGVMLVIYYGYIGLIAFDKPALARPIGDGVTTIGIPIGIGLIVITVILTAIYVYRANKEFDRLTQEVLAWSAR